MLDGMRAASQSFIGRAIMALVLTVIIVSFVFWGIGDYIRNPGPTKAASVGKIDISTQTLRFAYQSEVQNLQRRYGRAITNEQAQQAGIDRRVLDRLISQAALDQSVDALGLRMSDEQLGLAIRADPTFRSASGQFDRARFEAILRDNGYNEIGFMNEQRGAYLRQSLGEALVGKVEAPALLLEAVDRYRNETRSVEYFILSPSSVEPLPEPSAESLQKFFDQRQAAFAAPEYRKITLLTVTPAIIAKPENVSDADAQARYQKIKNDGERRQVQQIVYPDLAQAQAAADKIKNGGSFEAALEDRNLTLKDADLGLTTRKQIVDPAVAAAAFSAPQNVVSAPVQGAFGVVLLRVVKIEDDAIGPFADVVNLLKRDIATERGQGEVRNLHDKVEDARASGKSLSEAARAGGLEAVEIEAVDPLGHDKAGAAIAGVSDDPALVSAIFKSDIGVDNEAVATRDNGYKWFEIAAITPARSRSLEEARPAILAAWREAEIQSLLQAKAANLVKLIREGGDFAKIAADEKAEAKHNPAVKRIGAVGLDEAAIVQIFDQPNNGAGSAATAQGRLIFKILDSASPNFDPDTQTNKQIAAQQNTQLADDLMGLYVRRLERDYGVKINDAALRQATGGAEQ